MRTQHVWPALLTLPAAGFLLAACSGDSAPQSLEETSAPDMPLVVEVRDLTPAEQQDLKSTIARETGRTPGDMELLIQTISDVCLDEEFEFDLFISMTMDQGNFEVVPIVMREVCPQRLPDIDRVQSELAETRAVCDIPVGERSRSQAQIGEALGC